MNLYILSFLLVQLLIPTNSQDYDTFDPIPVEEADIDALNNLGPADNQSDQLLPKAPPGPQPHPPRKWEGKECKLLYPFEPTKVKRMIGEEIRDSVVKIFKAEYESKDNLLDVVFTSQASVCLSEKNKAPRVFPVGRSDALNLVQRPHGLTPDIDIKRLNLVDPCRADVKGGPMTPLHTKDIQLYHNVYRTKRASIRGFYVLQIAMHYNDPEVGVYGTYNHITADDPFSTTNIFKWEPCQRVTPKKLKHPMLSNVNEYEFDASLWDCPLAIFDKIYSDVDRNITRMHIGTRDLENDGQVLYRMRCGEGFVYAYGNNSGKDYRNQIYDSNMLLKSSSLRCNNLIDPEVNSLYVFETVDRSTPKQSEYTATMFRAEQYEELMMQGLCYHGIWVPDYQRKTYKTHAPYGLTRCDELNSKIDAFNRVARKMFITKHPVNGNYFMSELGCKEKNEKLIEPSDILSCHSAKVISSHFVYNKCARRMTTVAKERDFCPKESPRELHSFLYFDNVKDFKKGNVLAVVYGHQLNIENKLSIKPLKDVYREIHNMNLKNPSVAVCTENHLTQRGESVSYCPVIVEGSGSVGVIALLHNLPDKLCAKETTVWVRVIGKEHFSQLNDDCTDLISVGAMHKPQAAQSAARRLTDMEVKKDFKCMNNTLRDNTIEDKGSAEALRIFLDDDFSLTNDNIDACFDYIDKLYEAKSYRSRFGERNYKMVVNGYNKDLNPCLGRHEEGGKEDEPEDDPFKPTTTTRAPHPGDDDDVKPVPPIISTTEKPANDSTTTMAPTDRPPYVPGDKDESIFDWFMKIFKNFMNQGIVAQVMYLALVLMTVGVLVWVIVKIVQVVRERAQTGGFFGLGGFAGGNPESTVHSNTMFTYRDGK